MSESGGLGGLRASAMVVQMVPALASSAVAASAAFFIAEAIDVI